MEDRGALSNDLGKYFQIAVSGGIEQAFTSPAVNSGKPKSLSDEIADQVRECLMHTVHTTFKQAFQSALDQHVKSVVMHGFNINKLEELEHNDFKFEQPPPAKMAKLAAEPAPAPASSAQPNNNTAKPKSVLAVAQPVENKKASMKKKPAPLQQVEGLEGLSSLAIRSPIKPKIAVPSHAPQHEQGIVTTPLSYDSKKKTWTEQPTSAPADISYSTPSANKKSPLEIPEELELDLHQQDDDEGIETTPVSYKKVGDELEATEEEEKSEKATAAAPLPGSVLPANTNPDSKRAKFVLARGISLKTAFFTETHSDIPTTPVNAKGEEIIIPAAKPDEKEDKDEEDAEEETSPESNGDSSKPAKPTVRIAGGVGRKNSLRQMAFKNRKSLPKPIRPLEQDPQQAAIPAECQTPTPRTKKNLANAGFRFGQEEKNDASNASTAPAPAGTNSAPVPVVADAANNANQARPSVRRAPIEKVKLANNFERLKAAYEENKNSPSSSSAEPLSAGLPKKVEAGMECPSPTAKRGRLVRSATIGGLGSPSVSKTMPANAFRPKPVSAISETAQEECATPHSRELANAKFEFPKPKTNSTSAPDIRADVAGLGNVTETPIEPMD